MTSEITRSRLRTVGVWAGALIALALLYCTNDYLQRTLARGETVSWARELPKYLLLFGVWGVLAPALVWLVRRFPVERPRRARGLLVHLAAAPVVVVTHSALFVATYFVLQPPPPGTDLWTIAAVQTAGGFLLGATTYGTIVIILHTIRYQRALREREVAQSRLETQLAQARLTALRAQLNPHFLFNTLHSVSALMARDVPGARQMLTRLSDLLRLALETGADQECTLREEMEFVGHYIAIQEIRFRDRLQVSWDVAPDALEARVPRLLLQPLVENAIEHALDPHEERTRVRIAAARADGRLRLVVEDDGPGAGGAEVRERIGLGNTRARLAGLYGDAGTLQVRPSASGGTAVEVGLPFRAGEGG
jgi:two-component system LytT family sensor kinase